MGEYETGPATPRPAAMAASHYIPALDGMRAVSISLVVLSHLGVRLVPGLFGVTIFFFISGYLITSQLLQEMGRTGGIGLGGFYMRRLLRLYPALLVAILVGASLYALLGGHLTTLDTLSAVFYFMNINEAFGGVQSTIPGVSHPFSVLWSLSVEEWFYFIFPFATLACARRPGRFALLIGLAIVAVGLWRVGLATACHAAPGGCTGLAQLRIEHGTDTRADSILYGALLAVLLTSRAGPAVLRLLRARMAFAAGAILLLACLLIRDIWFRDAVRFSVQGVGLFLCIGGILLDSRLTLLRRLLSWRWLVLLGRWSYSLYLWHWIVRVAAGAALPTWLWEPVLTDRLVPPVYWLVTVLPCLLLLSLGGALLSYHFVERPMLALRRRFGSHAVADTLAAAR